MQMALLHLLGTLKQFLLLLVVVQLLQMELQEFIHLHPLEHLLTMLSFQLFGI